MSEQTQADRLLAEVKDILDLDELESRIYLRLLRLGPITASALAKDLDVDRARMYRTIEKLVSKKIVLTTFSIPKLCTAIEPEEALKLALEKKESEIKKIKKSGEKIIEKITEGISSQKETTVPTLRIVQGKDNIYSEISQLIENSTGTVYIVTTLEDISKMYHSPIPEKIKICEQKGGRVLLLVEISESKMNSYAKRFKATETRTSELPSKGRIVIQQGKHLIMSDSSLNYSNSETDFSISTNALDMVSHIENLCDLLWKSAKPLKN